MEWYRFNKNKISYITDLLHRDLGPLTDAVTKVLLTLRYFVHHRYNSVSRKKSATLYTVYFLLQIIGGIPCITKIEWNFPSLVLVYQFDKNQC